MSRLTQKADNVPDFSQTLSLGAYRWHILSQQKLISLVEAKKVAFGTVLRTKPLVHRFLDAAQLLATPSDAEKGAWLTIFALAKRKFIRCPGRLIWKLGIYGLVPLQKVCSPIRLQRSSGCLFSALESLSVLSVPITSF